MDSKQLDFVEMDARTITIPDKHLTFIFCFPGDFPLLDDHTIPIWNDLWNRNPKIIQSKVLGKLGLLYKIPARVCKIERVSKPLANSFLQANHLQGFTNAKTKYGLFLPKPYLRLLDFTPQQDDFLLAVMTFSGARKFRDDSLSYELLRFCVLNCFSVQGGFSKMLKTFISEKAPDSIMTFADLDWKPGGVYAKSGFKEEGTTGKIEYRIDESGRRVQVRDGASFDVFSLGSLKMIWKKS